MFKKWWNKIDGYKTLSGIIVTGIGGLMYLKPIVAIYATEVLTTGVAMAVGGLTHKAIKYKSKGNKNESKK